MAGEEDSAKRAKKEMDRRRDMEEQLQKADPNSRLALDLFTGRTADLVAERLAEFKP